MSGNLAFAFDVVRRTSNAHASAIDALERACHADAALLASEREAISRDRKGILDDRAAMSKDMDDKLARREANLEEQRAAVERDRADVDEEKAKMRASAPPPDDVVKLNVGGARFETSRNVLTKVEDSMLGRMFGRCDVMLQPDPVDGSIFIDRDGERFGMLLDFLRDLDGPITQRAIRALPEAAQESMVQELDYFGLEAAVFGGRPWADDAVFQPGPEMGSACSFGAAVSAGGRVVVVGGDCNGYPSSTTLLLDALTMAFTAGPNSLAGRYYGCAAVQLDADRVLVMGGYDGGDFVNTTEILHLKTLTLSPGPAMLSARCCCAAVALDARRFLVVGGSGGSGGSSQSASTEILSLDSMAFAPGPKMATSRQGCAAVALDEFRVLIAGGSSNAGRLDTTEVLDVRTMAFEAGPRMASARWGCGAVRVDARHVLVVGGRDSSSTPLATTELLDFDAMEFSPGPLMKTARYGCAAVRVCLSGGQAVLVLGGDNDDDDEIAGTELLAVDENSAPRRG